MHFNSPDNIDQVYENNPYEPFRIRKTNVIPVREQMGTLMFGPTKVLQSTVFLGRAKGRDFKYLFFPRPVCPLVAQYRVHLF